MTTFRDNALVLLTLGLCLLLVGGGCISVDIQSLLQPELRERVVEPARTRTRNKILLLDVAGIIASDNAFRSFLTPCASPEAVKAVLNKAETDAAICAVLLRIDTPGGEVTATDMIYHEIVEYRRRTGVPVLASLMGLGCSGGYYIACAADRIYTHPTTVTGSIGVLARFPQFTGLAEKIGYKEEIVSSGDFKSMGSPLREMTPAERKILQTGIDEMFERFLTVIEKSRPKFGSVDDVRPVADGRVYTAQQAVALGLADGIAYLSDVVDMAKQAAGVDDAKVIAYQTGLRGDSNIYSRTLAGLQPPTTVVNFDLSALAPKIQPGFYYLWLPSR